MKYENWIFGKDGALMSASAHGKCALASELLAAGANVNVCSPNGFTPLHRAAERGHRDVVELLLLRGADPSILTTANQTALSLAQSKGHADVVAVLQSRTRAATTRP